MDIKSSPLTSRAISGISIITKNLSRIHLSNPSSLTTNYSESISDIRKSPNLSEDLSQKFSTLNAILKRRKSDSLIEPHDYNCKLIETQTKPITGKSSNIGTQTDHSLKNCFMKDKSTQTDICEFAKIEVQNVINGNATNFIEYAEKFVADLESTELTGIPVSQMQIYVKHMYCVNPNIVKRMFFYVYFHNKTKLNHINQHNGYEAIVSKNVHLFTNKTINDRNANLEEMSNIMKKYSTRENVGDIDFGLHHSNIKLVPNIVVYESDHYSLVEIGEDAYEFDRKYNHCSKSSNSGFKTSMKFQKNLELREEK